ncbi:MAG: hypothetical protein HUN05_18425 [Desulfobacter sp.]|nr:MAG: hypothetical protein HUN05_18425 [Desulfobacter sp.]
MQKLKIKYKYRGCASGLLLMVLCLSCPGAMAGNTPLTGQIPELQVFSGALPGLTAAQVSRPEWADRFTPVKTCSIRIYRDNPVAWVKIFIPKGFEENRLLEVKPSFPLLLGHADLYLWNKDSLNSGFDLVCQGAGVAGKPRAYFARNFVFDLPNSSQGEYAYLKLVAKMDVLVGIQMLSTRGFQNQNTRYFLFYGLIYGILISMILYNFFIFAVLKDKTYFYSVVSG